MFFVLHGVNENAGLIPPATVALLLLYYVIISIGYGLVAWLLMRHLQKAFVFSFVLLLIFFFFGVFKDLTSKVQWLSPVTSYSIFLPALIVAVIIAGFCLVRSKGTFRRLAQLLYSLLIIYLLFEVGMLLYNTATGEQQMQDFGDRNHSLIKDIPPASAAKKPIIFWIVFDEYTSSSVLREKWDFNNPLDTLLQKRGFFVADSASSPYNFTHYSLVSTLDMTYLDGLTSDSVIRYRDIVRGQYSLKENNAVKLLARNGYDVFNYSIADIEDHPASRYSRFRFEPEMLVDNQTLPGRIKLDIAWNFPYMFKSAKQRDSLIAADTYQGLKNINDSLYKEAMTFIYNGRLRNNPGFYMMHMMFSHDPFIYNADGSLNIQPELGIKPERYVPAIQFSNSVIVNMVDSIQKWYAGRDILILLQGDHGFKFEEDDPAYRADMCKILYAVYSSDRDYSQLNNSVNSVNTFRAVFNKYLGTTFPELENRSFYLYYR